MGRHHMKLPDHLYLSPPTAPPASFLSVKSAVHFTSSAALFHDTSSSARAVGDRIPGFKTSAAFLTTLRANLNLELDSAPSSQANTPDSLRPVNMASSTSSLPPPSPSPLAQEPQYATSTEEAQTEPPSDPLAGVPDLITESAVSEDDKVDALKLVADSVAQQRQISSRAVIFHPITFGILTLLFGLIYQRFYKGSRADWAIIGTTCAGVLMTALVTVRWLGGGYIEEAERVGTWRWLDQNRDEDDVVGDSDEILLTRFGDEVIGALLLRGVREVNSSGSQSPSSGSSSPKKRRQAAGANKHAPVRGLIRAWTVKQRYRHKGVGTGLLEDAVRRSREKGWTGPEFADDHANSKRILPRQFNSGMASREKKAKDLLERVKEEAGVVGGLDGKSSSGGRRKR